MQLLVALLIPLAVNSPWPEESTTSTPRRTSAAATSRAARSTRATPPYRTKRTSAARRSSSSAPALRTHPPRSYPEATIETPSSRSTGTALMDPPSSAPPPSWRSPAPAPYSSSPPPSSRPNPTAEEPENPPPLAYASPASRRPPPPPVADEERPWYSLTEGPKLALGLDLGAFGAAGGLVYFRPWDWVRLNAGLSWNYLGFGLRGGASFTPWRLPITPSLNLEYGHFFTGDLTKFASASGEAERRLLESGRYSWTSAQLGVEFGSQWKFIFYVRGGFAFLWATVPGNVLSGFIAEQSNDTTVTFSAGDTKVTALVPCASLGFLVYIR